jgi:hypothetical protein
MLVYQRHHDYQLTIPTLPPGGLNDLPLQLDSDAPFALRLVKSRNIPAESGFMFQTPTKQFQSSTYRTDRYVPQAAGQFSQPSRGAEVRPPMVYPVSSQIICNVANNTGETITNARLLFRGSKLYAPGALQFPTYPARLQGLPFTYQVPVFNVPLTGEPLRDNQLRIRQDADFAFRYGVCDPFFQTVAGGPTPPGYSINSPGGEWGANFTEVYVQLKDEARQPYSNEPIHVNDLFGQGRPSSFIANQQTAGANDDQVLFFPGLFTPEIYIQREHSLYFDVYRNDVAVPDNPPLSGWPVNLYFRFQGMKVIPR